MPIGQETTPYVFTKSEQMYAEAKKVYPGLDGFVITQKLVYLVVRPSA